MRLARTIDDTLRDLGTPERAESEKRYLKSALTHYGVAVPWIRRTVKDALREDPVDDRRTLWREVHALWSVPVHERRMAAVEVLVAKRALLEGDDDGALEALLREAKTWALVDPLAVHVMGPLVTRDPTRATTLDRWSTDGDFWLRRASMLALLLDLRRGGGDFERFGRYADAMLGEREFFVRKCIGWVLREVANRRPALVVRWLRPRVMRASALTFREATRNLPDRDREALTALRAKHLG